MDCLNLILLILSCLHLVSCIIPGNEAACFVGEIIQNHKTKCLCIDRSIYECFTMSNVSAHKNEVEDIDSNSATGNQINDDEANVAGDETFKAVDYDINSTNSCIPEAIYIQGNTTCVCNSKGSWPHKACFDLFGSLLVKPKNHTKCMANSYVVVDCNICYCNNKGMIDKDRCTKKNCNVDSITITRKSFENNCVPKTWYSLSACQFCYCAEANKLVCNTGRYGSKRLELGTYNLTVCGVKFLQEAMELMPEEQHLRNAAVNAKPLIPKPSDNLLPTPKEKTTKEARYSATAKKHQQTTHPTTVSVKPKDLEYYSDSEETTTPTTTRFPEQSTVILSENEDNLPSYDIANENTKIENKRTDHNNNYDTKASVQEEDTYNDQYVDSVSEPSKFNAHPKSKNNDVQDNDGFEVEENGNKTQPMLTINIPNMISKVFNLRRSKGNKTVILKETKGKPCKQGLVTIEGCNKCFCLKNGKLLCTDEEC